MTLLHEFGFINLIPREETLYDTQTPVIYKHVKCYRQVSCFPLDLLTSLNSESLVKISSISKSKGGKGKQCSNLSTYDLKNPQKAK